MLANAKLPMKFWAEAVSTAEYLINRSPAKALQDSTPEEQWCKEKPDISNLKVFGCTAMVHIPSQKRQKWDMKSKKCTFLGYCEESKRYRFMEKDTHKIIKSRDAVFIENKKGYREEESKTENAEEKRNTFVQVTNTTDEEPEETDNEPADNSSDLHEDENSRIEELSEDNDDQEETFIDVEDFYRPSAESQEESVSTDTPRRSHRKPAAKVFHDYYTYLDTEDPKPKTWKEALEGSEKEDWKAAMDSEYNSLLKNNTWILCDLPEDKRVIQTKWIFKRKRAADGSIDRYKARLVAKGFMQVKGIDYGEAYSPVVRMSSIRLLFAIAVKYELHIIHLDVEAAYLQGELEDDLYIQQPEPYIIKGQ